MKTKLLKKLRKRASRKIKFKTLSSYIIITEFTLLDFFKKQYKQYSSYTIRDFNLLPIEILESDLRSYRRLYILNFVVRKRILIRNKLTKDLVKCLNKTK